MNHTIKAIETKYKGILFRSRLEAQWASFFDILGWEWEYEPFDLNGYIPDFILKFYSPLLVEVKPDIEISSLYKYEQKIMDSGWNREILIVGSTLFTDDTRWFRTAIGLLGEVYGLGEYRGVFEEWNLDAAMLFTCDNCGKNSICHYSGSFHCRVNGCYDGDHYIGHFKQNVNRCWAKAKNATRWHPNA